MKRYTPTLFPPLDRDYSILALRPVLIAGMVTPVGNGDGGVNLSMVSDNPAGLLTAVDPWQRMAEGDRIEIFWDDEIVASRSIEPADIDQRLILFLPAEPIVPDWAEKVFYRLTRAGSPTTEDSVPLRVRVKLDRPAGVDKDPHLPGHSELAAPRLPQDVIDNGVDAKWAAQGVPTEIAAYPGRAARDTIELRWGDATVTHRVTDAEAADSAPIVITVDQAAILAGGDSSNLLVHYQVFDEVWNFSTEWSLQTFVEVDANAQRLDAPIIKESVNGIIDLGQLGSRDVTVQIEVRESPFERNDTLTLTWKGTTNAGAVRVYTDTLTLTNIPSVAEINVPNDEIRAIRDGRGEATYVLTKANGDPPQSSKRTSARVTGKIPLPAPTVFEAVGDTLDPTLDRVHVQIPVYDKMAVGDLIDLVWLGTRQNGTPYLHETDHIVSAAEVGELLYIPIPEEHIAILANGTLDVSYRVSNDDPGTLDVRVSDHLYLTLRPRLAELPAPSVDEAPDGVLDPETITDHATYRMPYTGTAVGDILTWYWQGESPDGSASDWIPITSVVAGKPLTFNVPRPLIEPNINNMVKAFYSLKLASTGNYQYSSVLELIIGKLIGDLPAPEVLEANGNTLDPMQAQNGATVRVRYDSMDPQDIITLVWWGSPGAGTPPDQQKPSDPSGQVDFLVPASVIGANIAQKVHVAYQVKRYVAEKQSALLPLDIRAIPDNVLPTAQVTQANPQTLVLNLATFAGDATATVDKWPFITTGQRAWLRLEGETSSGVPHSIVLLDGEQLTAAQIRSGLSETVPRAELEKLGQDTPLTAACRVAFSGIADEGSALPLPSTTYQFKLHHDWVSPVIVSVRDSKGEVAEGGTTFDTTLALSGTGTIETLLEIVDDATQLATGRTDASGVWTLELPAQRPKPYSITARAIDGSGLISQPRTYEVLANVTPIIERVQDSRGPVSNGGTTVDTAVSVFGKASPDQQIELFDGTVSQGRATTDALGDWSRPVSGLALASHTLKAKALYGTGPESTLWTFTVAAAIAPTISSVKDADGDEIPADGFTVDTSVTLTGNATANLEVEIFDGAASVNTAKANANGVWTLPVSGLAAAPHTMKAKALYGNGAESTTRRFTVVASVTPTLTSVVDPKNTPISEGGWTYANNVTASGQASIHQLVEVFDGNDSKGTATTDANGAWTRPVSGLAVGSHSLTVKGRYGARPVSLPWGLSVRAGMVPTLTNVRDSKGEVTNAGSTTDTTVTASGKATANEQVQIVDGTTSKGNAAVNASGDWSHSISGLALGAHNVKAVALYGDEASSNIRTFTVKSPVPDFVLDRSQVTLGGRLYVPDNRPDVLPGSWPAGTRATRNPSSGVPPYYYSSSNSAVVTVDSIGTVTARQNGSVSITVRDSQGRSGSYAVSVTGIIVCGGFGTNKYPWAVTALSNAGWRMPNVDELRAIHNLYAGRWPQGNGYYWSSTGRSFNTNWVKNLVTGQEGYGYSSLIPHSICLVVGLR